MTVRLGSIDRHRPSLDALINQIEKDYRDDLRDIRRLVCEAREARHPRSVAAALEQLDRVAARGLSQ